MSLIGRSIEWLIGGPKIGGVAEARLGARRGRRPPDLGHPHARTHTNTHCPGGLLLRQYACCCILWHLCCQHLTQSSASTVLDFILLGS